MKRGGRCEELLQIFSLKEQIFTHTENLPPISLQEGWRETRLPKSTPNICSLRKWSRIGEA